MLFWENPKGNPDEGSIRQQLWADKNESVKFVTADRVYHVIGITVLLSSQLE